MNLETIINSAWDDRALLAKPEVESAINEVISLLDSGKLRVAQPVSAHEWKVNDWVKRQ